MGQFSHLVSSWLLEITYWQLPELMSGGRSLSPGSLLSPANSAITMSIIYLGHLRGATAVEEG